MASFGDLLGGAGNWANQNLYNPVARALRAPTIANPNTTTLYQSYQGAPDGNVGVGGQGVGGLNRPNPQQGYVPGGAQNNSAGSVGGGSGGGGSYNPNTDARVIGQRRAEIGGLRPQYDNLYNAIYGGINTLGAERAGAINSSATQKRGTMEKSYLGNQNQIGANFTGRGTYDSSYRANAQDEGTNLYKQDVANFNEDVNRQLGEVGKWVDQSRSQYQTDQSNYNKVFDSAGQAGDVNSLLSLKGQLEGHLGELNQALSGMKTNPQYLAALNAIAPQYDSTALQGKIKSLVASTAPADAKQAVLEGYFNSAGLNAQDQAYWKNYYTQLLSPQAPVVEEKKTATVGA